MFLHERLDQIVGGLIYARYGLSLVEAENIKLDVKSEYLGRPTNFIPRLKRFYYKGKLKELGKFESMLMGRYDLGFGYVF